MPKFILAEISVLHQPYQPLRLLVNPAPAGNHVFTLKSMDLADGNKLSMLIRSFENSYRS